MILSNDGLVAFHYRSYGTFFLHKNRLHNIHRGFTHYKYYRAKIALLEAKMYTEREGREILFLFLFTRICNRRIIIKIQEKACLNVRKFEHECFFCVIIFCE